MITAAIILKGATVCFLSSTEEKRRMRSRRAAKTHLLSHLQQICFYTFAPTQLSLVKSKFIIINIIINLATDLKEIYYGFDALHKYVFYYREKKTSK